MSLQTLICEYQVSSEQEKDHRHEVYDHVKPAPQNSWQIIVVREELVLKGLPSDVHGETGIPLQHAHILVGQPPLGRVAIIPTFAYRFVKTLIEFVHTIDGIFQIGSHSR